jgi:hypothetical protein
VTRTSPRTDRKLTYGFYVGDTYPKLYVNCWSSWTGGDWKATRQTSSEDESEKGGGGGGPPSGGKLAGIIVGAIIGCVALVALGVFAAKYYGRLKKLELVILEGQTLGVREEKGSRGTDKEAGAAVAAPEPAARVSGPSDDILEAPGSQLDAHEMDIPQPATRQSVVGVERVRTPYVDAQENLA